MSVRQVQVRGCLPTLAALVVVGSVLAVAVTAGVALLAVAAGAGLVAALVRQALGAARLGDGKTPGAGRRAADVTIDAELIERSEDGERHPPKRLE